MTAPVNLENPKILKDIGKIREEMYDQFVRIISRDEGKKTMIFDEELLIPLSLIVKPEVLRANGVEKIASLKTPPQKNDMKIFIFLVRPKMDLMLQIERYVKFYDMDEDQNRKQFFVYFVPRKTEICENILAQRGVKGGLVIREFKMDIVPLDEDLLSMEFEESFKEIIEGDITSLYDIATAIHKIQRFFGLIPNVTSIGKNAKAVSEILERLRYESIIDESLEPKIQNLVIIDRTADMLTPMATQLTYEGLVDELFGINHSFIDLEPEYLGKKGKEKEKYPLNSNDLVFEEIRDLNMGEVMSFLQNKAKYISESYDSRHQAKTIHEMRDFIRKLPTLQQEHHSLELHFKIAEEIINRTLSKQTFVSRMETEINLLTESTSALEMIQEMIWREEPIVNVLRLLCMESIVNNGLKPKDFDLVRRDILQAYGYKYIFTLDKMEEQHMLNKEDPLIKKNKKKMFRFTFPFLRKELNLANDNFLETGDITSVFSGYAPLSIRLIQRHLERPPQFYNQNPFDFLKDAPFYFLRQIPEKKERFYYNLKDTKTNPERRESINTNINTNSISNANLSTNIRDNEDKNQDFDENLDQELNTEKEEQQKSICLVFFVGGVTFAEISSLRILSQMENSRFEYVVATTRLVNGNTMLNDFIESLND
ncbi:vacuolar protein sorting-associated protein 33a [Anaeramoeba ignava]|uniref:Vacuolar protein sorting-associated protein 33a n=1 Tax=Anaeramoeba ignava TaxID=1746090 RepID=A0A9Q0LZP5_ANAIG|nr:vacuolar protein sorting-associated protein 33a [Anaeramoeba ignava]